MKIIEKIIKHDLCTGCGVCASIFSEKISIKRGEYNRPFKLNNLTDEEEDIIRKICPGLNQSGCSSGSSHPIWGPVRGSYVGYSNDANVRFKGSSGGVLTQVLIFALDYKIVDIVIQIGAMPFNQIENTVIISKNSSGIIATAGSRYSPASPLENIVQVISSNPGKKFAFVGKPCDCTALRNLMQIDEMVRVSVKLILSFFCAGTPSRGGVNKLLDELGYDRRMSVDKFQFRGEGWPGKATLIQNNHTKQLSYEQAWGDVLGPSIQNRCKLCADGSGEVADFVCADVWNCDEKGYPSFEEMDGQSLILPRTESGLSILNKMIALNIITANEYNLDKLKLVQASQFQRKATILMRLIAKMLCSMTVIKMPNQRMLATFTHVSLIRQLRTLAGSLLRCIKGQM